MQSVLTRLYPIGVSFDYWLFMLLFGLGQLLTALFYQYRLEYEPCVLCIHVRLWVTGLMVVALLALWLRRNHWLNALLHLATAGVMLGILNRGWQLLGTERGFIFGSCNFDAGLPTWFALVKWFPAIFEVRTSCGYTPELLFGITMAEALVVLSATMVALEVLFVVSSLIRRG